MSGVILFEEVPRDAALRLILEGYSDNSGSIAALQRIGAPRTKLWRTSLALAHTHLAAMASQVTSMSCRRPC